MVSPILLYFIFIRTWIKTVHLQNCIKNLVGITPSYFHKDNKYKTLKSSVKKTILETLQTYKLHSIAY